jgi:hypothetical protein
MPWFPLAEHCRWARLLDGLRHICFAVTLSAF